MDALTTSNVCMYVSLCPPGGLGRPVCRRPPSPGARPSSTPKGRGGRALLPRLVVFVFQHGARRQGRRRSKEDMPLLDFLALSAPVAARLFGGGIMGGARTRPGGLCFSAPWSVLHPCFVRACSPTHLPSTSSESFRTQRDILRMESLPPGQQRWWLVHVALAATPFGHVPERHCHQTYFEL